MSKPIKIVQQERTAVLRNDSVNIEDRTAEFVISSESVDSYDTVFLADGADFSRYAKNNVVTFNHFDWSDDPDMVVGFSEIRQEGKITIGKVYFEDAELNPKADKLLRKINSGSIKGASIRANIFDARYGDFEAGENPEVLYFTRWELVAWSIVTVPSNPDAVARNQKQLNTFKPEQKLEVERSNKMLPQSAQIIINKNRI